MKHRNTNTCTTRHTNNIYFFFLEKCFSSKPNCPSFRFFSIFLEALIEVFKDRFLIFSFLRPCFTIYNYHTLLISPIHLFLKQLESDPSPQSYLYFQDFQDSKLLNGCSWLWPNKDLNVFQWFFSIIHWHTVYS